MYMLMIRSRSAQKGCNLFVQLMATLAQKLPKHSVRFRVAGFDNMGNNPKSSHDKASRSNLHCK